ncbi:hypothetical protein SNARM312S_01842 [Streptomyces narbonensis]
MLYYRAHHMSGNTAFVDTLCSAVEDAGARALPLYVASLRAPEPELLDRLRTADAIVTTVLAAGGTKPAEAQAGGDEEAWDAGALAALDVPILQALCLTGSRENWEENDEGLSPLDAASQVAVPEFDGRLITVPFSFKEIDADGLPAYVADAERAARVAGIAVRHARLRHIPNAEKKLALVLSAYPTKHSRIGNAVGLDTPASAVSLLRRLIAEGYDFGPEADLPGLVSGDGDELIYALIEAGGHDQDWLTEEQLARNPVRIPAADYKRWYAELPAELRADVEEHWGPAPGEMFLDRSRNPEGDIVLAALRRGNLLILIQPPRGFGENPIAIYHDPDLPPSHHYLAAYRWIAARAEDGGFGADAMVHLGKHGNLEWLPGKNAGLSAACGPDAALGDIPLVYPFLVNDPGEGTQAKRRVHATLVDHLVPPMARAESYGDIARLEQLLASTRSPSRTRPSCPRPRADWTLIQAAKLDPPGPAWSPKASLTARGSVGGAFGMPACAHRGGSGGGDAQEHGGCRYQGEDHRRGHLVVLRADVGDHGAQEVEGHAGGRRHAERGHGEAREQADRACRLRRPEPRQPGLGHAQLGHVAGDLRVPGEGQERGGGEREGEQRGDHGIADEHGRAPMMRDQQSLNGINDFSRSTIGPLLPWTAWQLIRPTASASSSPSGGSSPVRASARPWGSWGCTRGTR